jgi:hypothetical protein
MPEHRVAASVACLLALLTPNLEARDVAVPVSALRPGDTVRFVLGSGQGRRRAVVLETTEGGLLLDTSRAGAQGAQQTLQVRMDDLVSLEVARGRRRHIIAGAAWGALAGGAGALWVGATRFRGDCDGPCGGYHAAFVLFYGAAGALVGTLVGAAIETDRFERVGLTKARLSVRPAGGGFAASLTLRF